VKVLITCPRLYFGGGVTNYYNAIRDWFSIETEFFEVGAREEKESALQKACHLWADRIRFYNQLNRDLGSYDLIHLNPSFDYKAIVRDGLLLRVAKNFGNKTLVMFHGWHEKNVKVIENNFFNLFVSTYNKADAFIVLSSDFKSKMRNWGFKQPIYVETTPVNDTLLDGFSIENKISRIASQKGIQILFLARIEKTKGICETIKAVQKLSEAHHNFHLAVAGDGSFMDPARQLTSKVGLGNKVSFLGYVRGENKKGVFLNSDIYVFPTYHGEGMPTSVLEAMAFGLPVITRPVGGLKDFFINGEHGFMTESKEPEIIAGLIEKIILDKGLRKRMSINVHEYAKERFMASKVTKRLEDIYIETIKN
jgi:glycosyltransferase involved in cell wall biosynthesis